MEAADREIYPSAPIRYVACEVRFPFWPPLATDAAIQSLHAALSTSLPLVEPGSESTLVVGPLGGLPATDLRTVRFLSGDRFRAAYFTPTRLLIETTDYQRYETFREDAERAVGALMTVGEGIAGVGRIGLRYIDEIRLPTDVQGPAEWRDFMDDRLLAPLDLQPTEARPTGYQGLLEYEVGEGISVAMRYGTLRGQTVGNAPLRLRDPVLDGPFFLVDIDSFWTATEPFPALRPDFVLDTCDRLHVPIRGLFESAITERLRTDVLRRAPR